MALRSAGIDAQCGADLHFADPNACGVETSECLVGLFELHRHVTRIEAEPDVAADVVDRQCDSSLAGHLPHERGIEQVLLEEADSRRR
jgi:hypothetical protein